MQNLLVEKKTFKNMSVLSMFVYLSPRLSLRAKK